MSSSNPLTLKDECIQERSNGMPVQRQTSDHSSSALQADYQGGLQSAWSFHGQIKAALTAGVFIVLSQCHWSQMFGWDLLCSK